MNGAFFEPWPTHSKTVGQFIMNDPYILKIKYLLGLVESKDVFDWAFQQVEKGNDDIKILDLLLVQEKNKPEIIEKLSEISKSKHIEKGEVQEYFYSMFIDFLSKSMDLVTVEGLILKFYSLVKDDFDFDESEKLSFSIIENDWSLRKSDLHFQITEKEIMGFLKRERQVE